MAIDIATRPECRRPTCHELVAIGKNGEPLKDCETHRDKRPSAKARKAAAAALTERNEAITDGIREADDLNAEAQAEVAGLSGIVKSAHVEGGERVIEDVVVTGASFGAPRPAPKPTARQKANDAISARLATKPVYVTVDEVNRVLAQGVAGGAITPEARDAIVAVPEPIVVLRADRNQVIVTLTAIGSTDAQAKAKAAARAAGHKITGTVASIGGGEAGSRKPGEWKITLDLRAVKPERKAKPGSTADFPVLSASPSSDGAKPIDGEQPIHTRFHKGSGKYLAEAIVNGKHIFRYAADAETAASKMRAHLATLG